jgi:hypothetical protein
MDGHIPGMYAFRESEKEERERWLVNGRIQALK